MKLTQCILCGKEFIEKNHDPMASHCCRFTRKPTEVESLRDQLGLAEREIARLKSNDRLMHETNCKLSSLALDWKDAKFSKPEHGKIVLIHCITEQPKKSIPLRAVWYDRFTEESWDNEYEADEYCEEKDQYFICEGWYEFNQCEEVHWVVSEEVTHWAEIPFPPRG